MERRAALTALAGGAVVGLGGCTSAFESDDLVELLRVGVINWTDETAAVQVRVDRDGERIAEETVELDPDDDGKVLDCTWPSEPGRFAVAARFAGEAAWTERDLTELDGDCATVYVMVESSGHLSVPTNTDCDPPGERC